MEGFPATGHLLGSVGAAFAQRACRRRAPLWDHSENLFFVTPITTLQRNDIREKDAIWIFPGSCCRRKG